MRIKCYLYKATSNLIIGETFIPEGEELYISNGYRRGSKAKNLVKVCKKDGTYLGEYYEDTIDKYNNFTSNPTKI